MGSTVIGLGIASGVQIITSAIDPTVNDWNYAVGRTKWINTVTNNIWEIIDNTTNNAIWKITTDSGSGSGDYITVIEDPYSFKDVAWVGVTDFDTSTAKNIKWEVSMSDNNSSSAIIFTVDVTNDESSQEYIMESTESGSNVSGCEVRVVFPSSGNASLQIKVTDNAGGESWRVVSKRLDM